MEVLKKILAVMIGILVVIVIAGGYYYLSMGSMDHSKTTAQMQQIQEDQKTKQNQKTNQQDEKTNQQDQDNKETDKNNSNENASNDTNKQSAQNGATQQSPQIVEVVPPKPKKDPQQYINEIQDSINNIERANSKILNNSSGSVNVQNKDSNTIISSNQDNMSEIHSGAYKMGQDVAKLQGVLDNMKEEVRNASGNQDNFFQRPPQAYQYQTPYSPNNNSYNPYYNQYGQNNAYNPYNQYPFNNQYNQGNPNNQNNGQNSNNAYQQTMPANHNISSGLNIGNLFSGQTVQVIFAFILIVSLFLGVVAVFGFISSLFKGNKGQQINQ